MATSRAKKNTQFEAIKSKFQKAAGIAFTRFESPTVMDVDQVRGELRKKGMSYTVVKKTLIALASKETNRAEFSADDLAGSVAVITSEVDEIAPAAFIKKFQKDFFNKKTKTSKFNFAGAVFAGKFLDPLSAEALANTPSREESFAKIIATLRHGPKGIHSMLTHGLRGITFSLKEAEKYAVSA